jgi:hypothetical protein
MYRAFDISLLKHSWLLSCFYKGKCCHTISQQNNIGLNAFQEFMHVYTEPSCTHTHLIHTFLGNGHGYIHYRNIEPLNIEWCLTWWTICLQFSNLFQEKKNWAALLLVNTYFSLAWIPRSKISNSCNNLFIYNIYYILAPKLNTVMTHGKKPGPFLDQCILIHTNPKIGQHCS